MRRLLLTGLVAATCGIAAAAQSGAQDIGTVRIPRAVKAEDQTVKPGTYRLRLTGESLPAVRGETPNSEQWVELLQNGQVKGKVVASVIKPDQIKEVAKGGGPGRGQTRVDVLKDNYVRIWVNRGGDNYLIHLSSGS